MACITTAWSSHGHALKFHTKRSEKRKKKRTCTTCGCQTIVTRTWFGRITIFWLSMAKTGNRRVKMAESGDGKFFVGRALSLIFKKKASLFGVFHTNLCGRQIEQTYFSLTVWRANYHRLFVDVIGCVILLLVRAVVPRLCWTFEAKKKCNAPRNEVFNMTRIIGKKSFALSC